MAPVSITPEYLKFVDRIVAKINYKNGNLKTTRSAFIRDAIEKYVDEFLENENNGGKHE